jgi:hypothetical protein
MSTPTYTPQEMSDDLIGGSSVGQSSKRRGREVEVGIPPTKKTAASIEECVRDIRDTVSSLKVSN